MIATPHLAAGVLGSIFVRPRKFLSRDTLKGVFWAIIVGLLSHVVLDMFPHQEYGAGWQWTFASVELMLIACIIFFNVPSYIQVFLMFVGMGAASLPDIITLAPVTWGDGVHNYFHLFHNKIQIDQTISLSLQSLLGALMLLLALLIANRKNN